MTGAVENDRLVDSTGLMAVQQAVAAADGCGFVHVGGRYDADRRYLTRSEGVDRETAVVFVPGDDSQPPQAVYCVPSDATDTTNFEQGASDTAISRRVSTRDPSTPTGRHVRSVLDDQLGEPDDRPLLVARDIPHDTAVFVQQAGYELQSTAAVRTARATKTPAELDCLTDVQQAAADGIARAEAVLARSDHDDSGVVFEGRPLSAEQLTRQINAALAARGVSPAANTRIEGSTTAPTDQLPRGEPICIHLAPQGPDGYHAHRIRTLVVDSEGGWERRASIAVEAGLQAAARHIEPGADISTVEGEIIAEIGAYGFAVSPETDGDSQARDDQPARAAATVHGVGLSTHERPTPGADSTLQENAVIAVSASVVDPTRQAVRLGTVRRVTEDGSAQLISHSSSLTPVDRRAGTDPKNT